MRPCRRTPRGDPARFATSCNENHRERIRCLHRCVAAALVHHSQPLIQPKHGRPQWHPKQQRPPHTARIHHRVLRAMWIRQPRLARYPDRCAYRARAVKSQDHIEDRVLCYALWFRFHDADCWYCVSPTSTFLCSGATNAEYGFRGMLV